MSNIQLPHGANGEVVQLTPNIVPKKITYITDASSATAITLNANTSMIEVTALTSPLIIRWRKSSSDTDITLATDGFHEIIPAGAQRQYCVPVSSDPTAPYTIVSVLQQAASAVGIVIEK